ncbi:MAG: LytTR family DNA-binding domain-containing protein, partial [bacterium]
MLYVEAQEHYLRVVLTGGEHLVLHGLSNAVRELEAGGAAGMQVHRSYWVAWRHVERVVADSTGGYCELTGGLRIPVSRRRARSVREAFD